LKASQFFSSGYAHLQIAFRWLRPAPWTRRQFVSTVGNPIAAACTMASPTVAGCLKSTSSARRRKCDSCSGDQSIPAQQFIDRFLEATVGRGPIIIRRLNWQRFMWINFPAISRDQAHRHRVKIYHYRKALTWRSAGGGRRIDHRRHGKYPRKGQTLYPRYSF
jgi:hypothetical protein